jgi:Family of unknown function (DUF5681)
MKTPCANEDDGDEIGYGKPPKKTRFKKGQSGNPKGRPKKKKSRKELFEEAWNDEITVNGRNMTRAEAFVISLVTDGIKGKASARNLLVGLLPEHTEELEDFDPSMDDHIEMLKTTQRFQSRSNNEKMEDAS